MDTAAILGACGSLCSIGSFLPQAWKIIRTGETRALSVSMYLLTVSGFAFWSAYGIGIGAWPIIVTNSVCFAVSAFILAMKLAAGQRDASARSS